MLGDISAEQAKAFIDSSTFIWHQRFELAPGVPTPGVSDVIELLGRAGVPADLRGSTVLDIGTANGGCAFEAERRGASQVLAVDIYPPDRFGFDRIRALCGSQVDFMQTTIYELPDRLNRQFDFVFFFGVLYHLRHPLLALDQLRALTRGSAAIETAVCDFENPALRDAAYVRFYRGSELAGDASNWFAPSATALHQWIASCGFEVIEQCAWPAEGPTRAIVSARPLAGPPEYQLISYERPIVSVRTQ
jgi:tRNA (mo5U34)-methyltransferase